MYAQQGVLTEKAQRLRKEAGVWLKKCREKAGLTQAEIARAIGLDWHTEISAFERGKSRVPSMHYKAYAKALGMDVRILTKHLTRYYDPYVHEGLFGASGRKPQRDITEKGGENHEPASR